MENCADNSLIYPSYSLVVKNISCRCHKGQSEFQPLLEVLGVFHILLDSHYSWMPTNYLQYPGYWIF